MAGILTSAARSELGSTLPVIAVQTGDQAGEVGVRLGWAADWLIPSFLEGIVTGAYIEGAVQSESTESQSGDTWGATGSVLLEFYFPRGWSTAASVQPPINWALDVLWQP
ncbi:MAG: hypothetical protein KC561_06590, partial [Myxococcales bacterium]|nr:hypothetical protein [Myxococcales bacterium]